MYFISFLHVINIVEKTNFLAHSYILLIHFDVMDNFGDD